MVPAAPVALRRLSSVAAAVNNGRNPLNAARSPAAVLASIRSAIRRGPAATRNLQRGTAGLQPRPAGSVASL